MPPLMQAAGADHGWPPQQGRSPALMLPVAWQLLADFSNHEHPCLQVLLQHEGRQPGWHHQVWGSRRTKCTFPLFFSVRIPLCPLETGKHIPTGSVCSYFHPWPSPSRGWLGSPSPFSLSGLRVSWGGAAEGQASRRWERAPRRGCSWGGTRGCLPRPLLWLLPDSGTSAPWQSGYKSPAEQVPS